MIERINWIDWAKALAAVTVVFCHLPQSQDWFYYRFLQTSIISVFFFISGYLKKDYGGTKDNWNKYWYGLIIPYIIYNIIVYPYWLLRYYILHGGMPDLLSALKPILSALLFEHENFYCESLNGPLWYLPAILVMHITIDICRRTKYLHTIIISLCIAFYFLYAANKQYNFLPNLTFIGIISRFPFYYLGYVMRQNKTAFHCRKLRALLISLTMVLLGIYFFNWHLNTFNSGDHMLHIALFYPVNFCFIFSAIYGCLLLNDFHTSVITNLSIGTLVIIGLHTPFVSLINFILEYLLGINGVICYHWYSALPIAIIICAILFPIIIWGGKYVPYLLGRNNKIL